MWLCVHSECYKQAVDWASRDRQDGDSQHTQRVSAESSHTRTQLHTQQTRQAGGRHRTPRLATLLSRFLHQYTAGIESFWLYPPVNLRMSSAHGPIFLSQAAPRKSRIEGPIFSWTESAHTTDSFVASSSEKKSDRFFLGLIFYRSYCV